MSFTIHCLLKSKKINPLLPYLLKHLVSLSLLWITALLIAPLIAVIQIENCKINVRQATQFSINAAGIFLLLQLYKSFFLISSMKTSQITLLKISLSISFLGILLLLFLSSSEPKIKTIEEIKNISKTKLNQQVKIQGNLTSIRQASKNFYILTIQDNSRAIETTSEKNITSDKTLIILGKLQYYKNKTQVKAEKIKIK